MKVILILVGVGVLETVSQNLKKETGKAGDYRIN